MSLLERRSRLRKVADALSQLANVALLPNHAVSMSV